MTTAPINTSARKKEKDSGTYSQMTSSCKSSVPSKTRIRSNYWRNVKR